MLPKYFGHSKKFLRYVFQDAWKYFASFKNFMLTINLRPDIYMLNKFHFCSKIRNLTNLDAWKDLGENISTMLRKHLRQFWKFYATLEKYKVWIYFFHFCPKLLGTLGKFLMLEIFWHFGNWRKFPFIALWEKS